MKRFLTAFTILLSSVSVQAQEIKRTAPSFDDFLPLLKSAGYELFSFDISSLKDNTYSITFVTEEYVDGVLVHDSSRDDFQITVTNRKRISDFPEEDQKKILMGNSAYDAENDIYKLARKINVGFVPASDSLKKCNITIENIASFVKDFPLKPLNAPGFGVMYMYDIRPFAVDRIETGVFTPLVLIGSFWYDSRFEIIRFCGEEEFPKDLSSETLKSSPHFYVLGIKVDLGLSVPRADKNIGAAEES